MTNRRLAIDGGEPLLADFLPFGRPDLGEDEIQAVAEVLRSGWLGMGQRTQDFERAFAEYVGSDHAVAVSSCTAGLRLALEALNIGPGQEVVTTPMTFAATINVILAVGATPVLADIDPVTLNLDPDKVAAAITPRTTALLPVHFGGLPCDLSALGREHGLFVVEDAAHAVGAQHGGRHVGSQGNMSSFSFYPNKNITTIEGGMVTTNDAGLAEELRLMRLHGLSTDAWKRFGCTELIGSQVVRSGFKYNFTDVQAVMGLGQLARLESFLDIREQQAARYDRELADLPVTPQRRPALGGGDRHALHLYVVLVDLDRLTVDRDQVVRALRAENVGVGMHYQAIHEHKYYSEQLPYRAGDLPAAELISRTTMSLPLGPGMSDEQQDKVLQALREVLGRYAA